jgi:hypothetical protein
VAALTRYGVEVGSAFSLLGQHENDLTAALGFTMARCKALSDAVLRLDPWSELGEVLAWCFLSRFWRWAACICWSAQLSCGFLSGLSASGQTVTVTGGLYPIVLHHRASQCCSQGQ